MFKAKQETVCILALVMVGFVFFYKTFHFGFFNIDDHIHATENIAVQTFDFSGLLLTFYLGLYYPLSMLSFALDWWLGDGAPWVFHLSNFILHLLGTLVLFKVSLKLWPKRALLALLIGLAFLLHPLKAESIVWITERKDVLSGLFLWLTVYLYLFYLEHRKKRFFLFANLTFLFSVASKVSVAGLPIFLLVLDWYKGKKLGIWALIEKIPFALCATFFVIANIVAQSRLKGSLVLPEIHYLQLFYKIQFYLEKFLFPWKLRIWYSPAGLNFGLIGLLAALLFIVLTMVIVKKYSAHRKDLFLGLSLFAIFLSPNLKLIPFGDESIVNDRYMYIALTGLTFAFFPFILQLIEDLWKKERRIYACIMSGVFATIVLQWFVLMHLQISYWKDSVTLWQHTAALEPTAEPVSGKFANALLKAGRYEEALHQLQTSEGRAEDVEAFGFLKNMFGRAEEAQNIILDGLMTYPAHPALLDVLGEIKLGRGEFAEARNLFTQALYNTKTELTQKRRAIILNHAGLANTQLGFYKEAEVLFSGALETIPNDDLIIYHLGFVLFKQNRLEEAKEVFFRALKLNPNLTEACNMVGAIFYLQKNFAQARAWFNRSLAMDPNFEMARNNLMEMEKEKH